MFGIFMTSACTFISSFYCIEKICQISQMIDFETTGKSQKPDQACRQGITRSIEMIVAVHPRAFGRCKAGSWKTVCHKLVIKRYVDAVTGEQ
jgi:hypothetical protein